VSESDILGRLDYLSDIKNLVSFERAMFEDYSFKYQMKIFLVFMSISPLPSACLLHKAPWTVYMSKIGVLNDTLYLVWQYGFWPN